jgi:hypothetical protein
MVRRIGATVYAIRSTAAHDYSTVKQHLAWLRVHRLLPHLSHLNSGGLITNI